MTVAPPGPAAPAAVPLNARREMRRAGARAVFERDFLVFTSRPRFLILRTLVVVFTALLLATIVVATNMSFTTTSSVTGTAVFGLATVFLPTIVLLLSPILAASCIASERALQTLQIVLASPVSPFSFVAAKFGSRFGVSLVLFFATLPLVGLCFLYGGVGADAFLDLCCFVVGIALLGTASGIVASSWSRGVAAAARTSYVLAIGLPLLHLAGAHLAQRWWNWKTDEQYLLAANPFVAWGVALSNAQSGSVRTWMGAIFLGCMVVVSGLAIAFSAWRVGREAALDVAPAARAGRAAGLRWANPVLDRGLRGTLLHRPRFKSWLALLFLLFVDGVVMAVAVSSDHLNSDEPHRLLLGLTTLVTAIYAMSSAAHAIASERETGALDMLLATRLTPADVARGKLAAVLLGVSPLFGLGLLHALVVSPFTELSPVAVVAWVVQTFVVTVFFAAFGLWCSACAASAGRAALRTYAFLIGGSIVHAIVAGVGSAILLTTSAYMGTGVSLFYVWGASPFFVGSAGLHLRLDRSWDSNQGDMAAAWVLWSAAYLAASAALLGWTTARLARRNEAD